MLEKAWVTGLTATAEIDANGDLETTGKVTHVTEWQRTGLHCLLVVC